MYRTVFFLCVINFMAYWAIAFYLGGDADLGKMEGGRFYLGSHGEYIEVSEWVFNYSNWHGLSTWVTHPLAFVVFYLLYRTQKQNA